MSPEEKLALINTELTNRGYGPVISRFKSFSKTNLLYERFAIEVRTHKNGQKVVIKISSLTDEFFTKSLLQEISTIKLFNEAAEKIDPVLVHRIEGGNYKFRLQQLVESFRDENFLYMVTLHEENDLSLDNKLSGEEKSDVLVAVIKYIKLFASVELPDKKEYYFYTVPKQIQKQGLLEASLLEKLREVYRLVEKYEPSEFPYTVACADPHAGNLVKVQDPATHIISIMLLDLEQMHKGSQFLDLALLYMASSLAEDFSNLPVSILEDFKKYWITDLGNSAERIMQEALSLHSDKHLAEAIFRAYVIISTMDKLLNTYKSEELSEVFSKGGRRIIEENLEWLISEGLV